jgi:hypothetical protein
MNFFPCVSPLGPRLDNLSWEGGAARIIYLSFVRYPTGAKIGQSFLGKWCCADRMPFIPLCATPPGPRLDTLSWEGGLRGALAIFLLHSLPHWGQDWTTFLGKVVLRGSYAFHSFVRYPTGAKIGHSFLGRWAGQALQPFLCCIRFPTGAKIGQPFLGRWCCKDPMCE